MRDRDRDFNNVLSFQDFKEVMNEWQKVREYQDEINAVLNKVGGGAIYVPDCSWALQVTLETMFCDDPMSMSNIEYFVYGLDFGKKYRDGMVTDGEGNYIKLATVADLYSLLTKEMRERG